MGTIFQNGPICRDSSTAPAQGQLQLWRSTGPSLPSWPRTGKQMSTKTGTCRGSYSPHILCGAAAQPVSRPSPDRLIHRAPDLQQTSSSSSWHLLPGTPRGYRCRLCFETDFANRGYLAEHLVSGRSAQQPPGRWPIGCASKQARMHAHVLFSCRWAGRMGTDGVPM